MSNYEPIESPTSFADGSLHSYEFNAQTAVLNIYIELWNEKLIKLVFSEVLFFKYEPGDFISEICFTTESELIEKSLLREFVKIPKDHQYKHIAIKDIDDFAICNVVSTQVTFYPNDKS